MSFFTSLQNYVTSGVAGLGLSPRKFSLSRQESQEGATQQQGHGQTGVSSAGTVPSVQLSGETVSGQKPISTPVHGFPKVLPSPNATVPLQTSPSTLPTPQGSIRRQSARGLEGLVPPRQGSFRQRNSPVNPNPPERGPFFYKRRQSWPEVDMKSTPSVQESDGSYFESFTALSWKRENRRMSAIRAAETRAETLPENEKEPLVQGQVHVNEDDGFDNPEQREQLYLDVLHTITNTVGAPAPGGQFAHYKEEMFLQAQRAFGVAPDRHYRLLHAAAEEKPRIIVLSVVVQEADGLEAKDANGFSDPYCMLGIIPAAGPASPLPPPMTPRTLSDAGMDTLCLESPEHPGKLRKHHSFRLSFKRKDGGRREHRDSVGPVPAKFIKATSVKPHTLSPKWNEKLKFDIDDINTDILHLDIWDHDDESSVMDAVSRLNEVRGVRGLGRFFKQVCQSARQGSQDDFLGCVNIPLCDIPSTGLEGWFKLEARSSRSTVQGRIRLKLWLSTREDHGFSEEENSAEIHKFEHLHMVFMNHELMTHEPTWTWTGDIPGPALTILHQMAVQADLTDLQMSLAKYVAAARINKRTPLDPKFIHRLLIDVDRNWAHNTEPLNRDLEQWLADSMNGYVEKSLNQIRRHREIFPALHPPSLVRLEFLLRSLGLLGSMRAFRQVCPFSKGVRGEIVAYLRKGSMQWAQLQLREAQRSPNPVVHYTTTLVADLQLGLTYYHSLFDNTNGIQYFSIIYKQFDAMLAEEVITRIETGQIPGLYINNHWTVLEGDREVPDTRPFEIFLALQEFSNYKQHLSVQPQPPEKPLGLQLYHEWFESILHRWLTVSKNKAIQRVKTAIQNDKIVEGEKIPRHSTSSIDCASCFYQLREFWRLLNWPDIQLAANIEAQIIDVVCQAAIQYADLLHQNLMDSGYFDQQGPFRTSDDMCVSVNNLEYVRRALVEFRSDNTNLPTGAENLLESTLLQLEQRAERVLSKVNLSMQAPLHKAVFHLAWSPDSLPANQAIIPLLEYLDVHLSALNVALLQKNFNRALQLIWIAVLNELAFQMDTGNDSERPKNFHERLYEALHLLVDFFNAEGHGLPNETLRCENYWRVEQRLQYHKTDTERLIDLFYIQRLQEQCSLGAPSGYGSLAVRAYFNHDSLCVEILHARDVIPLDPNGFSDPFVIIELLPKRLFSHCMDQQTNVQKKTLNPIFDECFEFSVTLEQCQHEAAMIAFTVMDHDVLTANDFAGEAFLGLNNIPGVADYSTSVDNFHGLKQIDLPLMHQKDKYHPILQILESRINDKQAMEFVRKQKARMTS